MTGSRDRVVLQFFSHGSNSLIVMAILGMGGFLLARGHLHPWLILLGVAIFALVEYLTHRFTLHARPAGNGFVRKLQRRLHYDHHVQPDRLDLLFIPPWFLIPVLAIYGALYFFLTASAEVTVALIMGNLLGLLHYERVHYIAHIPVVPRTAYGRWMKKYHLWHHFKNENYWYGVTNPLFDYLFSTWRDPNDVGKSATTRNIDGET
jgi:hypothetical protein